MSIEDVECDTCTDYLPPNQMFKVVIRRPREMNGYFVTLDDVYICPGCVKQIPV